MFGMRRSKDPPAGPFYKQRSWIGSALFLGFFLAMLPVTLLVGTDVKGASDSSREILSGVRGPLSPGDPLHVRGGPDGRPENCRTDDRDKAQPATAPKDVRWRKRGEYMVPLSRTAGPLRTDDADMWWCFARTPIGAVLAAHSIPVQLSGRHWRTAAEQQVVPGEKRDLFINSRAGAGTTDSTESGRFVGFALDSYSDRAATVRLLLTNPAGGYLATSTSVHWRDGDWKVVLQGDGSLYSPAKQGKPDGFVIWGAPHDG
ncbi:hypothetical protein [Streptomyces sp. NPDC048172]|uniref:hypothetical protein n=1 Tax=Streptomyces sp. NPDC048172 TaxID=3365505 RepID=UPI0037206C28